MDLMLKKVCKKQNPSSLIRLENLIIKVYQC